MAVRSTQRLPTIDLEILKLLWKDLYSGNGFGLTRKEIFEALKEKTAHSQLPIFQTDAALRSHLRALKARDPSLMVSGKAETNVPGGKPLVYKFDRDITISWPTTAFMLIQLWQFQGRAVERHVFIEKMLQLGIKNSSTGMTKATRDELSRQIDTSIAWGYINLINRSVLLPTDRIQFEHDLLKFIASHLD